MRVKGYVEKIFCINEKNVRIFFMKYLKIQLNNYSNLIKINQNTL